jgi:hypothetical protein
MHKIRKASSPSRLVNRYGLGKVARCVRVDATAGKELKAVSKHFWQDGMTTRKQNKNRLTEAWPVHRRSVAREGHHKEPS